MLGDHSGLVLGLHRTRISRELLRAALAFGVVTLDTAPHYQHDSGHQQLVDIAGELLGRFAVCTKVGYRRDRATGRPVHSLDPRILRSAVEDAAGSLGCEPAVLWLHNPERSLARLPVEQATHRLGEAAAVLADAVGRGWCRSWGIATWDPHLLRPAITALDDRCPTPGLVMARSGLLAPPQVMASAEQLAMQLAARLWGMSPFGGDADDPVWTKVDARQWLLPDAIHASQQQAALRLAYELPSVQRVAVGASTPAHLAELVTAPSLPVNTDHLAAYRRLLERRASSESTSSAARSTIAR